MYMYIKYMVWTYLLFLFGISAPVILNYWYLKVNFLGPENLLWDQKFKIIFDFEISSKYDDNRTLGKREYLVIIRDNCC